MPHNKRESEKTQQHQERMVIVTVRGPASYPDGGFTTGQDTSTQRVLRRITEAGVINFMNHQSISGILVAQSGFMTLGSSPQSGVVFSQVVSVGISGNQLGIACYNMSGIASGPQSLFVQLTSGADISDETIKVLCQGY